MIGQISGVLIKKNPPLVMIDVKGIGFEIEVPMSTYYELPKIGDFVVLTTHFLVREDAQQLFGFMSDHEKITFKSLIKVNGIGPRVALAVLSGMNVDELVQNIENNETENLVRIPGIGKKTAERMLIELRGKINVDVENKNGNLSNKSDLLKALISLGYSEKEAKLATKNASTNSSLEENIKVALKNLSS